MLQRSREFASVAIHFSHAGAWGRGDRVGNLVGRDCEAECDCIELCCLG